MVKKELVKEVGSQEFNKIIKEVKGLVICDFYATWCMPCVMMAPVMESLAEKNKTIKFIKVNVDESQELAEKYEISSIPCIVFIKGEEEVDRLVGAVNENLLQEKIKDYLKV
jgi:thioredoxin 1